MSTDERLLRLENSFNTLVELARSADERLETQQGWINQLGVAQTNLEEKMTALVDAQIQTERAITRLSDKVDALTDRVDALAEIQRRTSEDVARLTSTVARVVERGTDMSGGQA